MNLPADFVTYTKPLLGEQWNSFVEALNGESPASVRINNSKIAPAKPLAQVPWCDSGFYLDKRPQFTFDPLFHSGSYYVQEASSMFIARVLKQYASPSMKVLDLCAAPGGKSTLIADFLDDDSLLVSNEVIRSRANILSENITKWGYPDTVVTNNDPSRIGRLKGFFDVVLVDAPCSGEGMFRKDERAVAEWSLANVKLCKERQQRILVDIWPSLKNEGVLIYSTCTYNLEENEENIRWIRDELGADILPVDIVKEWGISSSFVEDVVAYRFFPHKTNGEGFFCAVLRKKGDEEKRVGKIKDKDNRSKINPEAEYKNLILNPDRFTFYLRDDRWFAFPSRLYSHLQIIRSELNIVSEGICLGEFKGKDFVPCQSLALSRFLNKDAFITLEVDWKTAVLYLRKETLVLTGLPKGYILLTYGNIPLGFVKNIGNRANNLYPREWRIRSSNVPDQFENII
ncbi:MAG: RsmB/NOP family class I SAM-dependent RNA methyltransferase [Prevotella sp.]|jgi:16S rRNA C967 or C1407 C5-methylase (RsmB/RsmF family)/NOL1/NOP2/fmu family ribosome biogenesis protein|nr:RsmB/NOP family class I SAM-dependent RNA methyltransferase [Prevotella sp.]